MCAFRCVRVVIVTTRTYALLYRSAPPSEFILAFLFHLPYDTDTLPVFCSAFASASPLPLVSAFCFCSLLCSPSLLSYSPFVRRGGLQLDDRAVARLSAGNGGKERAIKIFFF